MKTSAEIRAHVLDTSIPQRVGDLMNALPSGYVNKAARAHLWELLMIELQWCADVIRQEHAMPDQTREALAAYAHEAWAAYMGYFLSKCIVQGDGALLIPAGYVQSIERLIAAPYQTLSDRDKDSDRKEADKILEILQRK